MTSGIAVVFPKFDVSRVRRESTYAVLNLSSDKIVTAAVVAQKSISRSSNFNSIWPGVNDKNFSFPQWMRRVCGQMRLYKC